MTFDEFIDAAWKEHGDQPAQVAERIAGSLHVVTAPEQVAPMARLIAHLFGEHLGQWQQGERLLQSLRALPGFDDSAEAAGALRRGSATLRYAGGDAAALDPLGSEDRVAVLAAAAAMFTGRGELSSAIAAYDEALKLAADGLPPGAPAVRALAVGGNNLACVLEEKPDRSDAQTRAMVRAAEGGLRYWTQAGTWLEQERAEYRLARSLLQAGEAAAAVTHASRCVSVCLENDAPAFEQFFGQAVLCLACRAAGDHAAADAAQRAAAQHYARVPAEERSWCDADRKEIGLG